MARQRNAPGLQGGPGSSENEFWSKFGMFTKLPKIVIFAHVHGPLENRNGALLDIQNNRI